MSDTLYLLVSFLVKGYRDGDYELHTAALQINESNKHHALLTSDWKYFKEEDVEEAYKDIIGKDICYSIVDVREITFIKIVR